MSNLKGSVLKEIGLDRWPPFIEDKFFWFALLAGVVTCLILLLTVAPTFSLQDRSVTGLLFMTVIYYPVLEEILFRGIIQGWFMKVDWGIKKYLHISAANWITSGLFVIAHFYYQPVLWSVLLMAPSLVFGFFRDHYRSIYPSIGLHVFYNAGFMFINIVAQ